MKHVITVLAAAAAAVGVLPSAHATDNDTLLLANNVIGLSFGLQHQNYREISDGKTLDSNVGAIKPSYRLYANAQREWLGIPDLYLAASVSYASGQNRYDGAEVNWFTGEARPLSVRTPTRLLDWHVRAGKAFNINQANTVQWIPYLEYGQHRWDRLDSGYYSDYSEYYRHSVIGIGAIGQYAPTEKLVFSVDAQFGRIYDASVRAPALEGLIDLGNGYYLRGADGPIILGSHNIASLGLGVDYAVKPGVHVTANYGWQRYGYGRGYNNAFEEPKSVSMMQRLELGIALTF